MHDVNPGLSQVFLATRDLYRAATGLNGYDNFTVKDDEAQQQAWRANQLNPLLLCCK